jgi:hypothetical protein
MRLFEMKWVHTITASAFADTPDEATAIQARLMALMPVDFAKERISFSRETCVGFNNRQIIVVRLLLTRESHTTLFLKNIKLMLGSD